jgi:photosynthetic reaction center cytochrome c subunit
MSEARSEHSQYAAGWSLAAGLILSGTLAAAGYAGASGRQGVQAPASAPAEPTAEQVYKNVQVLKGIPASQIRMVMSLISASLGARCDQCHVPDAFEKEDKRAKQTARQMIQMTLAINKNDFEGQTQVACFTCHRGQERPVSMPAVGQTPPPPPAPGPPLAAASLPAYDQIVEKYLQAVGTQEAFGKLKTRVMKGTLADARGGSFPIEIDQSAPDKIVTIVTRPNGIAAQGYNGATGWSSNPGGSAVLAGMELAQIRRTADLARALKIREESLSARVIGKVTIGEKEAYLVSARGDGQRVQLCFDTQTGLLLRRVVLAGTVLGVYPEQTDFDDYREIDGVKLPFVTRNSTPNPAAATTITIKEITHNVPVEDSRFIPPTIQR